MDNIVETEPLATIAPNVTMTITVNGKEYVLENTPRLKWSEIGRLAGIPMGPRPQDIKWTNQGTVTVTVPGEKPRPHLHGHSLIVVDGMSITAAP